jgi:hypothetical protein
LKKGPVSKPRVRPVLKRPLKRGFMKNMNFFWCWALTGAALISSCVFGLNKTVGNGHVTIRERAAGEFDSIFVSGAANVNIHFAEKHKVTVTTDSNIQDIVRIKTENNILRIDEEHTGGISATKLAVDVYMPKIKKVNLAGAGNINLDSGSGQVFEALNGGAGNIYAEKYQAQNVTVIHSGIGTIKIWASDTLTVKLSGIGNIFYKGDPKKEITKTGIGVIKSL